jgi:hypothetical protein
MERGAAPAEVGRRASARSAAQPHEARERKRETEDSTKYVEGMAPASFRGRRGRRREEERTEEKGKEENAGEEEKKEEESAAGLQIERRTSASSCFQTGTPQ